MSDAARDSATPDPSPRDAATSATGFHSGLNQGAVWNVPAVFVCMHNGWAISVPASEQDALALSFRSRQVL